MILRIAAVFRSFRYSWRLIFGLAVPLLLLPLPLVIGTQVAKCAYVVLLMAAFFVAEPVPICVTALLPVFLFPLFGILSTAEACYPYMKDTMMMFLGGLIVAAAVEECNLHKRIALKVLLLLGTTTRWLMLGFMLTTMFLSMWISNTATTAMMVPIVEAVLWELEKDVNRSKDTISCVSDVVLQMDIVPIDIGHTSLQVKPPKSEKEKHTRDSRHNGAEKRRNTADDINILRKALFLSVAYSANIGGTATQIGTGPNLVMKGLMEEMFPESTEITFATWMMYNVPGMLLGVFITWTFFNVLYIGCRKDAKESTQKAIRHIIEKKYEELGPIKFHEGGVLVLFIILVLLWLFRDPQFIPGWADALNTGVKIRDATPAIGISFLLFLIPSDPRRIGRCPPLLDWRVAQNKIAWGILLLLGGGFALSEGAKKSGLSDWVGHQLVHLSFLSPEVIIIVLCLMTASITEVVSNMSTSTVILPVVGQLASEIRVNPLFLMIPVTIACSFAFMLPVANPPNAIVFDSAGMKTIDMVKPGIFLNIIMCGVDLMMINTLGVTLFNLHTFPNWAELTPGITTVVPTIPEVLLGNSTPFIDLGNNRKP
ncbi:solute carrier family 13 member 5-like [Limulus polyphemus]|uniref:Solute carrier family 13 member 5-like n=1 Tax=Limulus polyphemus TaxID=6850 RepID=A0ABM1C4Y5_LIMPO|nr:solute carrier family 13 member 5-like [Limulus polyphemus]